MFNLEMAQAVIAAAEAERSPVVLQISPRSIAYAGLAPLAALVRELAAASPASIALHLDHGPSFTACDAALDVGFTSVMFDGASLPFAENAKATRAVAEMAHRRGAAAEGEIGEVGHATAGDDGAARTDPDEARRFVRETGVDAVAVAIGSIHGMPATGAIIDLGLVAELRDACDVPLVMHGSSGVDDATLHAAIEAGICKVNLSTALQLVFMDALRASAAEPSHRSDARAVLEDARAAVSAAVRHRMRVAGSAGRAG